MAEMKNFSWKRHGVNWRELQVKGKSGKLQYRSQPYVSHRHNGDMTPPDLSTFLLVVEALLPNQRETDSLKIKALCSSFTQIALNKASFLLQADKLEAQREAHRMMLKVRS